MSNTTNLGLFKHDNPPTNENQFDVGKSLNENWDKIDEFAGEQKDINSKVTAQGQEIENLNKQYTQLNQGLQSANMKIEILDDLKAGKVETEEQFRKIYTDQERQDKLINGLKDSAINITTDKQKSLHIEDSSNLPAKINIFGNSEQESDPSLETPSNIKNVGDNINLFDRTAIEIGKWLNKQGVVQTSSSTNNVSDYIDIENMKYIAYQGLKNINPEGVNHCYYDVNKTFIKAINSLTIQESGVLEIPSNAKYIRFTVPDISLDIFKIEEGNTITSYSPYNCGNILTKVFNKNIANADEVYHNMKTFNSTRTSETTVDEKDCIRFYNIDFRVDGLSTPFNLINYKYKENTSYTVRMVAKKETEADTGSLYLVVLYTDGTKKRVNDLGNDWYEFRIVTDSDKTIERIGFEYGSPAYWLLEKSSIFISEGDTIDYVENEGQKIVFPLEEGQRLMLGDTLIDGKIVHNSKKFVIDGTEKVFGFTIKDSGRIRFSASKKGTEGPFWGTSPITICNIFGKDKFRQWGTTTDVEGIAVANDQVWVCCENVFGILESDDTETGKTKIKNYLANNNIIFEQKIETPETEDFTEEQKTLYEQLQNCDMYKPITNIITEDNMALIEANYIADTKTYIDNKTANMQKQLNIINELLSTTSTSAKLLDNLKSDLEREVL